jgi:hypothetical protein
MVRSRIPEPAISAITGTYRYISFLTPVLEVNVVQPVKLSARYAVTAGMVKSKASDMIAFIKRGIAGSAAKEFAKGIAASSPYISPLVLKSCVGMNGRRAGNSTVPVITVVIAARAARGPARR